MILIKIMVNVVMVSSGPLVFPQLDVWQGMIPIQTSWYPAYYVKVFLASLQLSRSPDMLTYTFCNRDPADTILTTNIVEGCHHIRFTCSGPWKWYARLQSHFPYNSGSVQSLFLSPSGRQWRYPILKLSAHISTRPLLRCLARQKRCLLSMLIPCQSSFTTSSSSYSHIPNRCYRAGSLVNSDHISEFSDLSLWL